MGAGSGLDPPAVGMESEGRCFGVHLAGEAGRTGDWGPCWEGCGGGRGRQSKAGRLARSWGGAAGDGAAAQQGLSRRGRARGPRLTCPRGLFRAWQPRRGGPSC